MHSLTHTTLLPPKALQRILCLCTCHPLCAPCFTQDSNRSLHSYGVHARTRLLVMRASSAQGHAQLAQQEDRAQRLARLKDAAAAIAARGDGRFAQ